MSAAPPLSHVHDAQLEGGVVRAELDDGASVEFHRYALRDACPCSACRHPVSGQRLFESNEVLLAARINRALLDHGGLRVEWSDGHTSFYPADWLEAEAAAQARGGRPVRLATLWGAELAGQIPVASYAEVVAAPAALAAWLEGYAAYGIALLRGLPLEHGSVARVAELFSHVRVTNYGAVFDVRVRSEAANLAESARALSLHTDNPYRNPAPTLQLLACLTADLDGGETVVADGFRAVELLRELAPEKLELLASQTIRFGYRDRDAELSADVSIVTLAANGSTVSLQLNNRAKGVPVGSPEHVARWYEAYFSLLALLESNDAQLVLRLEQGELLALDNQRVLHGRRGFNGLGERHLQGCYADRDGLLSTLAVLAREQP